MGYTETQKQALVDNLQLEIIERSRRLRAQYEMQALGVRSRLEIRVNRIPVVLRKLTISEVITKHETEQRRKDAAENAALEAAKEAETAKENAARKAAVKSKKAAAAQASPAPTRGKKRTSDDLDSIADKENTPQGLHVPKKRAKVATAKSIKTHGIEEMMKPAKEVKATSAPARAATRATSRQKAPPRDILSPKPNGSDSRANARSAATAPKAKPAKRAPVKETRVASQKKAPATTKKQAVPTNAASTAPAAGGRVLRKRN